MRRTGLPAIEQVLRALIRYQNLAEKFEAAALVGHPRQTSTSGDGSSVPARRVMELLRRPIPLVPSSMDL